MFGNGEWKQIGGGLTKMMVMVNEQFRHIFILNNRPKDTERWGEIGQETENKFYAALSNKECNAWGPYIVRLDIAL